jgi:hypothetical protein
MDIHVKNSFCGFRELVVVDGNTAMSKYVYDVEERRALASQLIEAAEDLLYGDMSVAEFINTDR